MKALHLVYAKHRKKVNVAGLGYEVMKLERGKAGLCWIWKVCMWYVDVKSSEDSGGVKGSNLCF